VTGWRWRIARRAARPELELHTRACSTCVAAAALLCTLVSPAAAQPRVRLIATGGTIANARDGRWTAEALVGSVPTLPGIARVEPETFARAASLALSLDDWLRLSRRIGEVAAEPDLSGIVVTSGTDTLEELAWFLDLTVRSDVPVVVTGAIRKPGNPEADGPDNLADAVRVAASPSSRGRGTVVVFHGSIFSARDAVKTSTVRTEAFSSAVLGPVGRVSAGDVRLGEPTAHRHARGSEFDVGAISQLARVDVLLTYQQAPGDLVTSALRNGARGLVISAAGAGAISLGELEAVEHAMGDGIPVVLASRVEDGHVTLEDVQRQRGLIAAGDLAPLKARILLMLAISQGLEGADLERVFREY
jgi:L-asparaginase